MRSRVVSSLGTKSYQGQVWEITQMPMAATAEWRAHGGQPWGCSGPWAQTSNLCPHTSGEKLLGLGKGLMGFSEKPRLPLTCSYSSLYFVAMTNNYLHDLRGSPRQPYDIIMPISQVGKEATETDQGICQSDIADWWSQESNPNPVLYCSSSCFTVNSLS